MSANEAELDKAYRFINRLEGEIETLTSDRCRLKQTLVLTQKELTGCYVGKKELRTELHQLKAKLEELRVERGRLKAEVRFLKTLQDDIAEGRMFDDAERDKLKSERDALRVMLNRIKTGNLFEIDAINKALGKDSET